LNLILKPYFAKPGPPRNAFSLGSAGRTGAVENPTMTEEILFASILEHMPA
jgi:hypothetical protein